MALTLYFHPLSSFCHKVLIALYENNTPFVPRIVDLMNPEDRAAFIKMWPIGKFPVVRDEVRGAIVPESSIIIEHLSRHHPGPVMLVPADPERASQARAWDRFFDLYVNVPMQKIVTDKLRPEGQGDGFGVGQAREQLATACGIAEQELAGRTWAMGNDFTMADCAAAPALFYADRVMPFGGAYPHLAAYLDRLKARPSFARVLAEAEPYFKFIPM